MHPVYEHLLKAVEADPLPAAYTSSYWQRFGREAVVERHGEALVLRGVEFGAVATRNPARHLCHWLERLSYRAVTASLPAYPAVWRAVKQLARDCGYSLTFDVWKSGVALATLADHWERHELSPRRFALIGDGYGFLGVLIRRWIPEATVYCIDLPKTLVFQARTHERAFPQARMAVLDEGGPSGEAAVTFVPPPHVERIPDRIDCAVNIASMQEMNPFTIATYFTMLRRRSGPQSRFYCVNRQRKELPGGEVSCFDAYPWRAEDEIFLDGPCPYYTRFLALSTRPSGPRVAGVRVPFVNGFDGVHWHRLARLAPEASHA